MNIATAQQIGSKLIPLLGLPKYTKTFELRCAADEAVRIFCTYYPEKDGVIKSVELLSEEYTLVPRRNWIGERPSNADGTRVWPGEGRFIDVTRLASSSKDFWSWSSRT